MLLLIYLEITDDLALSSVSSVPMETDPAEPPTTLESGSDERHIGDIQGLSVEEVAKRLVADALSRAVNQYCATKDTDSVSVFHV